MRSKQFWISDFNFYLSFLQSYILNFIFLLIGITKSWDQRLKTWNLFLTFWIFLVHLLQTYFQLKFRYKMKLSKEKNLENEKKLKVYQQPIQRKSFYLLAASQRISFQSLIKNCNHKCLGIYYLLSAFIFGISGTLISVLTRI